jgi:hypothetical protein
LTGVNNKFQKLKRQQLIAFYSISAAMHYSNTVFLSAAAIIIDGYIDGLAFIFLSPVT